MKNNQNLVALAKKAMEQRENDYSGIVVFTFFGLLCAIAFNMVLFTKLANWFSELTAFVVVGASFALIVIAIAYGTIRSTLSFLKCKKYYKSQNYAYYYKEVQSIRGSIGEGFWADFTFNGKTYSQYVKSHKVKYVHVFDCDGEIIFTIDELNLLK